MKLIVGLGNPGSQYALTRHNVGFIVVDALSQENGLSSFQTRFKGLWTSGVLDPDISCPISSKPGSHSVTPKENLEQTPLHFFKPLDFMNRSGPPVGACAAFYKIPPEDILVIHDDIELEPGKIRVKQGGSHGGHNGIKSLESSIGKNFWRLKIGVGRPSNPHQDVATYVLEKFRAQDENWLVPLIQDIVYFFPLLLQDDKNLFVSKVMQQMQTMKK